MLHFFKTLLLYSHSGPALIVVPNSEVRKTAMLLLLVARSYDIQRYGCPIDMSGHTRRTFVSWFDSYTMWDTVP